MRFVPRKRTALDGRVWWCVYDTQEHDWSGYSCFGKYKTKKRCQFAIDCYSVAWNLEKQKEAIA